VERNILDAIAELHAARLSLQGALLALDRAVGAGERAGEGSLRVLAAEFRGTGEEAAVFAALFAASEPALRPCPEG